MRFEPVLPPDTRPKGLELIDAVVVRIPPKECSRVLKILYANYNLEELGLDHLKRVRSAKPPTSGIDVVVAPASHFETDLDLTSHLSALLELPIGKPEDPAQLSTVAVPRWPASSTEEREAWKVHWPVDFLEPSRLRVQSEIVTEEQIPHVTAWAEECIKLARKAKEEGEVESATLIVDPYPAGTPQTAAGIQGLVPYGDGRGLLKGSGCDRAGSSNRPLKHAVMEAVEAVAAAERDRRKQQAEDGKIPSHRTYSQAYLCTNYDIYTYREPCIMCAMALVHSRVARVFFVKSFDDLPREERRSAGYSGETKIHALSGTNHRYKVYQCVTDEIEEQTE